MYHGPLLRFLFGSMSQALSLSFAYFVFDGMNVGTLANISRKYAQGFSSVILRILGSLASIATSLRLAFPSNAALAPFIGKRKSTYHAPFEGSSERIIVFL